MVFNSQAVITGDITQIDLPKGAKSGLRHAIEVLDGVNDISFNFFSAQDVVRHPIVARIVQAYEEYEANKEIELQEKKQRRDEQIRHASQHISEQNLNQPYTGKQPSNDDSR